MQMQAKRHVAVPMHVRRVIETTVAQNPAASRKQLNQAVQDATFCDPDQAIDWVQESFKNAAQ